MNLLDLQTAQINDNKNELVIYVLMYYLKYEGGTLEGVFYSKKDAEEYLNQDSTEKIEIDMNGYYYEFNDTEDNYYYLHEIPIDIQKVERKL